MTYLGILAAAAGAWTIAACIGTAGFSFVATRLKRLSKRPTYTNLAVSLPPVPPSDLDFLDDLPAEVLSDDEITVRFARIVSAA